MPREAHLLKRNGRYQLNMRVPQELLSLYGKKKIICNSLHTSDYSESVRRIRYESFKQDAEFNAKLQQLQGQLSSAPIKEISNREAHNLVFQRFINLEKLSQEWCDKLDDDSVEDVLDNLRTDEVVFSGGSKDYRREEADTDLDSFLKSAGIECPKSSPAYEKLLPLFTKARLENVRRTMARVTHQTVSPREPLFREVFAHTPPPSTQKPITIANMVDGYLAITCATFVFASVNSPMRSVKESADQVYSGCWVMPEVSDNMAS